MMHGPINIRPYWNEEILGDLKVKPVDEKLRIYKSNWL